MNGLYNYYDYEEAYYHGQVTDCKKIGLYLLAKLKDKKSKQLYEELAKIEYSWDLPKGKLDHISKVLLDIKIWLMVNTY